MTGHLEVGWEKKEGESLELHKKLKAALPLSERVRALVEMEMNAQNITVNKDTFQEAAIEVVVDEDGIFALIGKQRPARVQELDLDESKTGVTAIFFDEKLSVMRELIDAMEVSIFEGEQTVRMIRVVGENWMLTGSVSTLDRDRKFGAVYTSDDSKFTSWISLSPEETLLGGIFKISEKQRLLANWEKDERISFGFKHKLNDSWEIGTKITYDEDQNVLYHLNLRYYFNK